MLILDGQHCEFEASFSFSFRLNGFVLITYQVFCFCALDVFEFMCKAIEHLDYFLSLLVRIVSKESNLQKNLIGIAGMAE